MHTLALFTEIFQSKFQSSNGRLKKTVGVDIPLITEVLYTFTIWQALVVVDWPYYFAKISNNDGISFEVEYNEFDAGNACNGLMQVYIRHAIVVTTTPSFDAIYSLNTRTRLGGNKNSVT